MTRPSRNFYSVMLITAVLSAISNYTDPLNLHNESKKGFVVNKIFTKLLKKCVKLLNYFVKTEYSSSKVIRRRIWCRNSTVIATHGSVTSFLPHIISLY